MKIDLLSDINKDYAVAMNYDRVDRFMVNILWWHFATLALLTFSNSVLQAAHYYPSPFSWRLITGPEAVGTMLIGLAAALIPTLVQGKLDDHYLWRVFISVALITYSYLFVFISGGSIEMHFHFFMILALIVIYSDWRLGWIILVLTALHHTILNYIEPTWVYFYGRNDIAVVAHALPVLVTTIFTTLLCQNQRSTVERLSYLTKNLTISNEKLDQANQELQDFAQVASHDLQEPLRKIQAFGDRLQAKFGAVLGEEGCDSLARMQNAAGRMQSLINDLLAYTRVTRLAQPQVAVNLAETTHEVVSDLEVRLAQTDGRVEVDTLPIVYADSLQMRQLLQNLISNALKFHRPGARPLVKVYARPCQDLERNGEAPPASWQIMVEDNGIGFDEKYLDRIFKPFQRLHGRNEYEGTGMGLAICHKIVERHRGSLTAKSRPGQGTTFIITLPSPALKEIIPYDD